jgi:hypothetical protein
MKYFDRQAVTILLVTVVVCLQLSLPNHTVNAAAAAQPRIRNNRNPGCDEDQQNKMNKEYQECQQKFTNLHHTNIGTAITTEDHQKYTCKLLADTVTCDDLMSRCDSPDDVQKVKDSHIIARINQYSDSKDGIKVEECDVAKEYLESDRANAIDETTVGACTHLEASKVQSDFQKCSHNLSQKVWADLQTLEEQKQEEKGIQERETNDVNEEEERIDEAKLDPTETKPLLCKALRDIGETCTATITRCFSQEDTDQMRYLNVQTMGKYYGNIYDGVDLSDCPALRDFEVSPSVDPCEYPDEQDEFGNYPDCEDSDNPEINPSPHDDDDDGGQESQIEKSQSSNGESSSENLRQNNGHDSETKTEGITQHGGGDSLTAQHLMIALSSFHLAILYN